MIRNTSSSESNATSTIDFATRLNEFEATTLAPKIDFPLDYNGNVKEYCEKHGIYLVYYLRFNGLVCFYEQDKERPVYIQRYLFVFNNGVYCTDGIGAYDNAYICTYKHFSSAIEKMDSINMQTFYVDIIKKVAKGYANNDFANKIIVTLETLREHYVHFSELKNFALFELEKDVKNTVSLDKYNMLVNDNALVELERCELQLKYNELEKERDTLRVNSEELIELKVSHNALKDACYLLEHQLKYERDIRDNLQQKHNALQEKVKALMIE